MLLMTQDAPRLWSRTIYERAIRLQNIDTTTITAHRWSHSAYSTTSDARPLPGHDSGDFFKHQLEHRILTCAKSSYVQDMPPSELSAYDHNRGLGQSAAFINRWIAAAHAATEMDKLQVDRDVHLGSKDYD